MPVSVGVKLCRVSKMVHARRLVTLWECSWLFLPSLDILAMLKDVMDWWWEAKG